jgi:hypothetical protein
VFRSKSLNRVVLTLAIAVFGAVVANGAAGASSATPPQIVVKPNNAMINTKVALTGTGFPARTKLTIKECSAKSWVVPQKRCVTNNSVSVRTDRRGRFTSRLKVELCGGKRGPEPTSQICYIGDPQPRGVDTITLVGAARVVVTYP